MGGRSRTLGELAELVGGEVEGDRDWEVTGVRSLERAGRGDLASLHDRRYLSAARATGAGAILIPDDLEDRDGLPAQRLLAPAPQLALVRILEELYPAPRPSPGVHETAVIDPTARVAGDAAIGPYAVIGAETEVEAGAVLSAHVVVGRQCRIGPGVVVHPHVSIYDRTELEEGCVVHSGAVLGGDGFGYAPSPEGLVKVPQVGRLVVESGVEIGANSAVDRGALEETRIGTGTKIDNLVQVGHNVILGPHCVLCGQAGVAGSLVVGKGVVFGGQAGAAGHLEIGDGVQIAGKSAVFQTVQAGEVVAGIPAGPIREWRRQSSALRRLPELLRRVARLERWLSENEEGGGQ